MNAIQHTIKYGDNLYMLANYYATTVEDILANNRPLDPYNLQIGQTITICPNTIYENRCISQNAKDLSDAMNTLWEQHVFWTRLLLISIGDNLKDLEPTKRRLLRNSKDIANIYRMYYGDEIGNTVENLLTEHLKIGEDLIMALKNGETEKAKTLEKQWYKNADEIAEALSSFNPYYHKEEVQRMLYRHLELTTKEVSARLKRDYEADIAAFDQVEQEALMMASYFTQGIQNQFPSLF